MSHRKTVLSLAALVILCRASEAQGPPPNDECPGASAIADGIQGPFENTHATLSTPLWPLGPVHRDVWFRYVPTSTETTVFRVVSASFFHAIEALQGSCASLTSIAAATNLFARAEVAVSTNPGVPVWLRVGGLVPEYGIFSLEVFHVIHGSDECSAALPISLGRQGTYSSERATTSSPPWGTPYAVGNDVWFEFASPCEGWLEIDACSATFDSAIEVFEGTCGALMAIAAGDDGCGPFALATQMDVWVRSGVRYLLRVGGLGGATGRFDLELSVLGGGCHARRATGCGALTIDVQGFAAPGEWLDFRLGNVTGNPWLFLGTPTALAVCPVASCELGVTPLVVLPGFRVNERVPPDPVLSGATFSVQGLDLGATTGCPPGAFLSLGFAASDTFDTILR